MKIVEYDPKEQDTPIWMKPVSECVWSPIGVKMRKNKIKDKPYNHKLAVDDINVIEKCLDNAEYAELVVYGEVGGSDKLLKQFTNAKESLYRLKKWLEGRV